MAVLRPRGPSCNGLQLLPPPANSTTATNRITTPSQGSYNHATRPADSIDAVLEASPGPVSECAPSQQLLTMYPAYNNCDDTFVSLWRVDVALRLDVVSAIVVSNFQSSRV